MTTSPSTRRERRTTPAGDVVEREGDRLVITARVPIDGAGENDRILDIVSTAQLLIAPGQQGAVSDMTLPNGTGALAISQLVKSLPGQVVVIQEMNEPKVKRKPNALGSLCYPHNT